MGSKKGQALCCLELIVLPPLGGLGLSGQMCDGQRAGVGDFVRNGERGGG